MVVMVMVVVMVVVVVVVVVIVAVCNGTLVCAYVYASAQLVKRWHAMQLLVFTKVSFIHACPYSNQYLYQVMYYMYVYTSTCIMCIHTHPQHTLNHLVVLLMRSEALEAIADRWSSFCPGDNIARCNISQSQQRSVHHPLIPPAVATAVAARGCSHRRVCHAQLCWGDVSVSENFATH